MSSVITVLKEQINSFYLIRRLSLFELKIANNNNYLGLLWELLNPAIQITMYWFVFGMGIRGGEDVDGIPYLQWMLAGVTIWFFINQATLDASKSIYTRLNIIAKMNFPLSVVPSYVIFSKFYSHLVLLGLISIIFQFTGFQISVYYLQLPYFLFATISLIFATSLITSTLATIVRDVQMIVQSVMRILFFVSPILWTTERLGERIQEAMKINPLYYIAEGYRAAFLRNEWYMLENPGYTLYFWGLILFLLTIGSMLHVRFRSRFVDFI
ncbi:ABC transporter permease [Litchfieldia alkalitelluris]|uniref:ABC transporter permease n=1 Tax=Litchfieldia alkalitelluris TaxID=304268 RepID=UPI000996CF0A|nr:ABC transporter permease [Litchfieldia alkalitelluris]